MKVLILGCGWVGEAFGSAMLRDRAEVFVSTTSVDKLDSLRGAGFEPYLIDFDRPDSGACSNDLPSSFDFVLNSVPASKRMDRAAALARFNRVNRFLSGIHYNKHVYLSSIGIYPDADGEYDESFGDLDRLHPTLRVAEDVMLSLTATVVFRLGGLFGRNRILAKYFAGKVCEVGEQPANFVHLEDVVRLIKLAFQENLPEQVYNVVAPKHPKKEDVIRSSAERYGFALPTAFQAVNNRKKIVSGERLAAAFDYSFLCPSPLDF